MKVLLTLLAVLFGLVVTAGVAIGIISESKLNTMYQMPGVAIKTSSDTAVVQRGKHLAEAVSVCIDCHGPNLEGGVLLDDPLVGQSIAPNLTRGKGGIGDLRSDNDLAKIIRYGVFPDGRSVSGMPSYDYLHLSDADLAAVISFIRSKPAVESALPPSELRFVGRALVALGLLQVQTAEKINPVLVDPIGPPPAVTLEYGQYLANAAGCTGCHGPGLSGGAIPSAPPDWPPAANLTTGGSVGLWSEAQFLQTIRTGANPGEKKINEVMPTKYYAGMTEDELKAIWLFIQSRPAKEFGNR